MEKFQNPDYGEDIRKKIPGYDAMLGIIFDIVLPANYHQQPEKVLAIASQADELAGLDKHFKGLEVTLVEPSSSMMEQVQKQEHFQTIRYIQDTFEAAPISPSTYQLSLCLLVLHFAKNPKHFLRKIYDSLQDGGLLVLSLFSKEQLEYWRYFALTNGVPKEQVDVVCQQPSKWMTLLSAEQVENLLKEIGFSSIERICQMLPTVVWLIRK